MFEKIYVMFEHMHMHDFMRINTYATKLFTAPIFLLTFQWKRVCITKRMSRFQFPESIF